MENTFTRLQKALYRIKKWRDQSKSIFVWLLMSVFLWPLAVFMLYGVFHVISKSIMELWFHSWLTQISKDWFILTIVVLSIGFSIVYYITSWVINDIRTILLLRELGKFNTFWGTEHSKIQNIDEILKCIESIHKAFSNLPILKQYAYAKDSKYLFLQKLETEYFIEILLDLRSDLATRLTEQQEILEWAKSEVEHNITGTPELLAVSELQKARLDRQIEQFEELQRVLIKV